MLFGEGIRPRRDGSRMKFGEVWTLALVLVALVAVQSPAHAQSAQMSEKGLAHFKAGNDYLNDPDGPRYEDALREFGAAALEGPTSWRTQHNIGLCAQKLERDAEAVEAYERALALSGAEGDPAWRQEVERDIRVLKAALVRITIHVQPSGASIVDERIPTSGKPIVNRYDDLSGSFVLGIHPGRHRMSAVWGSKSAAWEFDAEAGASLSHDFALPQEAPTAPQRTAIAPAVQRTVIASIDTNRSTSSGVYVGAIATGVLAVAATVTGVMALSKKSSFNDLNDGFHAGEAGEARKSAQQLGFLTDGLLAATVLAASGTIYLYATSGKPTPQQTRTGVQIRARVGRATAEVALLGAF
jgi:hypothetical protein